MTAPLPSPALPCPPRHPRQVGSKARPPVAKVVSYREVERRLQEEEREAARRTREQKKLDKPKEMQFSPRWVGLVWSVPWLSHFC